MRFCVFNDQCERREGLKTLLRQLDRRARFCECRDWRQIENNLRRVTPELIAIDWCPAWMRAEDLERLLRSHGAFPTAILVDEGSPEVVTTLLKAGALGIVPRRLDARLIVRVLELVLLGGHYVPAGALNLERRAASPDRISQLDAALPRRLGTRPVMLSPRQHQIMRFVHMGNSNKMIARSLGISEGTVKIHLTSVFQQLGAPNRAAAVAIYNGWLTDSLEVLREPKEAAPAPIMGQAGPVPLRRRACHNSDVARLPRAAETPPLYSSDSVAGAPAMPRDG